MTVLCYESLYIYIPNYVLLANFQYEFLKCSSIFSSFCAFLLYSIISHLLFNILSSRFAFSHDMDWVALDPVCCPRKRCQCLTKFFLSVNIWENAEKLWAGSSVQLLHWSSLMKQLSSLTEIPSVNYGVNAEHNVQSNSAFLHDAGSCVTESCGEYLLESGEVIFQLSRHEGCSFVD